MEVVANAPSVNPKVKVLMSVVFVFIKSTDEAVILVRASPRCYLCR